MNRRACLGLCLAAAAGLGEATLRISPGGRAPPVVSAVSLEEKSAFPAEGSAPGPAALASVAENLRRECGRSGTDADETPWGSEFRAGPDPSGSARRELGALAEKGDLAAVFSRFEALETREARREAFRWLARSGDNAALASALAVLWTTAADDPVRKEYLQVLNGMDDPELAGWLADSWAAVKEEEARARLLEILAMMKGPATLQAWGEIFSAQADPLQREAWLALLKQRTSPGELSALMRLAESGDDDVAAAAAIGVANIGGWEACLWLADAASEANARAFWGAALASGSSAFSQSALISLAADRGRSEAVRSAALVALASPGSPRSQVALANHAVAPPRVENPLPVTVRNVVDSTDDGERWF